MARRISATAILMAVSAAAGGGEKGIHLPGAQAWRGGSYWRLNDGAGYLWDIYAGRGHVNSGTNSAYSGGMQLRVSGSTFSVGGSTARLSADGREIEIGPWQRNNMRIWRRVYVDGKGGYCRWVDIFENTGTGDQTIPVQYYSNMGSSVQRIYTTGRTDKVTRSDWGLVTGYTTGSSRPFVMHVYAMRSTKVKPVFTYSIGSNNVRCDFRLKVPVGKTRALCMFEAQRRPETAARKLLDSFPIRRELLKLPPALRRIVVNMSGALLLLGGLEFERDEEADLLVLRQNENRLKGTILNTNFAIEAPYGKLNLSAERVVGFRAEPGGKVHLALTNGQVVGGILRGAPIKIKLVNGNEMTVEVDKLQSAAFRVSSLRPEQIAATGPMVVLRSGWRLLFAATDADTRFLTQYGQVALAHEDLRELLLEAPAGGLHRAVFTNGSVLSGLMTAEAFKLRLTDLGPTLTTRRERIQQFIFSAARGQVHGLVEMVLRNDDRLYGRIADQSLLIHTRSGNDVSVTPRQIAEMTFGEEVLGHVSVALHAGSRLSGRLDRQTVNFQIDPGPKLPVSVGHISSIKCPKPAPASAPATRPAGELAPGR